MAERSPFEFSSPRLRVFSSDHHHFPRPDHHRFPIEKYERLRRKLVDEGTLKDDCVVASPFVLPSALRRAHEGNYVDRVLQGELDAMEQRRIGFPWSPAYRDRSLASVGGTMAAVKAALDDGLSGNLAGGTHHARRAQGAGYCTFNDLAVAAYWLVEWVGLERILIFDADVHQGDGTAEIFSEDRRVFTCSIHGALNFPMAKAKSDLDIALPDGTEDQDYLASLNWALDEAFRRSEPEFLLYQAGVDGLAADRLGRLSLGLEGLKERDRRVIGRARELDIPIVVTLGGGYAEPIEQSVEAHAQTFRLLA